MSSGRRGQRSGPSQQDQHPNHWQQSPSPSPLTTSSQMYTPHAASMPIPVPLPTAHAHSTVMQHFPPQVMGGVNQAPLGYTAHRVNPMPATANMAAAMRYPSNTSVIAGLHLQQAAPTGSAILRPNNYPS